MLKEMSRVFMLFDFITEQRRVNEVGARDVLMRRVNIFHALSLHNLSVLKWGGEEHGEDICKVQVVEQRRDEDAMEVGSDSGTATMTSASSNRGRGKLQRRPGQHLDSSQGLKDGPCEGQARERQDTAVKLHLCQVSFVGDADRRHLAAREGQRGGVGVSTTVMLLLDLCL